MSHLRFSKESLVVPFFPTLKGVLGRKTALFSSRTSHILLLTNRTHQLPLFNRTPNVINAPNLHLSLSFDSPGSHVGD
jgi:hypothetical protein